ncbi:syndecan isoform X2 [Plodia interpunctella]|uniref:syndecan isoform X2 n=1 Tax=Plodia interpunctella TaxID=58824 RepID=UPI0023689489|nr:syndecan isoform X2 [Plodia interpunctella]
MHLRIYLWLSCVVLAGYVRATEDPAASAVAPSNQAPPEYVDDDGSGLEDESSGSGWGAGPGVDDEDGRGSARLKPSETSNTEVVIGGARDVPPSRPDQTDISISGEETNPEPDHQPDGSSFVESKVGPADNGVLIMNKPEDQATSFFAQPGILAAVIGGAVVGLLCAILVVMFIVYRMRKKDEGSYALDEPKRSPAAASYGKGHNNREFYA